MEMGEVKREGRERDSDGKEEEGGKQWGDGSE